MCGIAGSFGFQRVDDDVTRGMLAQLIHRGPDEQCVVSESWYSLGTSRLAITDPKFGRQPHVNHDLQVAVAFNGEIYNYRELWKRYAPHISHGVSYRSDTHLIPFLFRDLGIDFLGVIDGMFAIALIDIEKQNLYLARDRFGEKPLYYSRNPSDKSIIFASEISALVSGMPSLPDLDLDCLPGFLAQKHVMRPRTGWKGLEELNPASFLRFSVHLSESFSGTFWSPSNVLSQPLQISESKALQRLEELLVESIQERMPVDVSCAFSLSGGIDSSLVAVLAHRYGLVKEINTFTLVYEESDGNLGKRGDQDAARVVADLISAEHTEVVLSPTRLLDEFSRIIASFGQPFIGTTSLWFLADAVSEQFKVMISGDGADELLGSYLTHRLAAESELSGAAGANFRNWIGASRLFSMDEATHMLWREGQHVRKVYFDSVETVEERFLAYEADWGTFRSLLLAELQTIFPDQVLRYIDRLSMAHSLEIRAPFLDHQLSDFLLSLPASMRLQDGQFKWVLRAMAERHLPDGLVRRPKEGFVSPIFQWKAQVLRPLANRYLTEEKVRDLAVLNWPAVKSVLSLLEGQKSLDHRDANKVLALAAIQEWLLQGRNQGDKRFN